jgi:uncharacterized membrane protein YfcA
MAVITGYFIYLLAGFVTGIVTGLVGASAIVVFVPIILLFLNYSLFALIGVSLSVDVFVSLFAWIIYRKFKHIDFKIGFYLSILAVVGAVIGSFISKSLPGTDLLGITSIVTALTGIMLFRRKTNQKEVCTSKDCPKSKIWIAIVLSFFIGLLGGAVGSAGGILIFLLLIFFLNFETHRAIGTSIFVMFFIALSGSISHIKAVDAMGFHWILLVYAVIGGIIGSLFSASLANVVSEKKLNKVVGIILFVLGILTFIHQLFM